MAKRSSAIPTVRTRYPMCVGDPLARSPALLIPTHPLLIKWTVRLEIKLCFMIIKNMQALTDPKAQTHATYANNT